MLRTRVKVRYSVTHLLPAVYRDTIEKLQMISEPTIHSSPGSLGPVLKGYSTAI